MSVEKLSSMWENVHVFIKIKDVHTLKVYKAADVWEDVNLLNNVRIELN